MCPTAPPGGVEPAVAAGAPAKSPGTHDGAAASAAAKTSSAAPQVAVVFSGKRCSGKDFACARLLELLAAPELRGSAASARRVAISDGCKRSYARATPGVDEARLFRDRAYKEEHREALIRHFREVDARRPGTFLGEALAAADAADDDDEAAEAKRRWRSSLSEGASSPSDMERRVRVLIFTDIRRAHELERFEALRAAGSLRRVVTIRIEASLAARRSRGWEPAPVDELYTETELDSFGAWNAIIENSGSAGDLDDALRRLVLPLVLSEVGFCSTHVHHAACGCVPRDLQHPRPPRGVNVLQLLCAGVGAEAVRARFDGALKAWAQGAGIALEDLSASKLSSAALSARLSRSLPPLSDREGPAGGDDARRLVVLGASYGSDALLEGGAWPRHLVAPTNIVALDDRYAPDFGAYIRGEAPWRSHAWAGAADEESPECVSALRLDGLARTARSIRDYAVFQVLPANCSFSSSSRSALASAGEGQVLPPAPEVWHQAIEGLGADRWALLDTRRLTTMPKSTHRPFYHAYTARINQQFENPPFSGDAIRLRPSGAADAIGARRAAEAAGAGSCCHFDTVDTLFEQRRFAVRRHAPVEIGRLDNIAGFMQGTESDEAMASRQAWNVQDMPIKFPGTDYRLPSECAAACGEFVEKVAEFAKAASKHHDDYYCYLTLTLGEVDPWKTQRRPGMHADGFKSYLTHPNCDNELNELVFLSVSSLPPVSFNEGFDVVRLDPGHDDIWAHCSQRTTSAFDDTLQPFGIYFLDGFNLHAVQANKSFEPCRRAFVRLMYSTSVYDRLGNAKNPLFSYDWEMRPASMQMPPPFWARRCQELGMAPGAQEEDCDPGAESGWVVYSDGLRGPPPKRDANFRAGGAGAAEAALTSASGGA